MSVPCFVFVHRPVRVFLPPQALPGKCAPLRPASKRRMLALALAQCAFTPPPLSGGATASGPRAFLSRAFLGAASAEAATSTLVLSPLPSSAAASPQQVLKSRAIYGSRVFRLQDASAAVIIDEKNVFDLFLTGAQS